MGSQGSRPGFFGMPPQVQIASCNSWARNYIPTETRVPMWLEEGVQRRLQMCGPTHPSTCLGAQATKFD